MHLIEDINSFQKLDLRMQIRFVRMKESFISSARDVSHMK